MPLQAAISRSTSSADRQRGNLASRQWATAGIARARSSRVSPTEVEKPQKRAEGGNQLLRCRYAALAGAFQKKVSYGLRIPLADILAERLE